VSGIDRLTKYAAQSNPDHVKGNLSSLRPDVTVDETSRFREQANLEDLTRATLATEFGVRVFQIPMYQACVKEINLIQNRAGGGAAMMAEVMTAVNKWVSRGLNVLTLNKLALDIFDIAIPPTP
jgi:hypothetical protein